MTKKALLVGINDYAPVGAGGPDLRGCVNDVRDVANTLSVLGVVSPSPRTMRILTDARATRAAIITGVKWLIKGAKKGDVLIFHYSGHGSYVADVSGDEVDGRDETICPHDFATAGMIKDDDLRLLLAGLPAGVNLDIIFDSCHSGSATRATLDPAPEEQVLVSRYIEPPIDWGFFVDAEPSLPVRGLLKSRASEVKKAAVEEAGLNHVLWAGCRDNQTSAETLIGGVYRGVFTYHFCKALRGAGVGITRKRLDAQVSTNIRGAGYSQIPQLEGSKASLVEMVFT
ncbi:MAG: caspase family protein [Desulfobulbaceae bacterium]|nr:caspase family protein [Desulfobulbaceae bacterium]